jgi:hypothetical protein
MFYLGMIDRLIGTEEIFMTTVKDTKEETGRTQSSAPPPQPLPKGQADISRFLLGSNLLVIQQVSLAWLAPFYDG